MVQRTGGPRPHWRVCVARATNHREPLEASTGSESLVCALRSSLCQQRGQWTGVPWDKSELQVIKGLSYGNSEEEEEEVGTGTVAHSQAKA